MTPQDKHNLAAAFSQRFPVSPNREAVREWMREVRWILGLSPGGMNKAYKILDAEAWPVFGVRLL